MTKREIVIGFASAALTVVVMHAAPLTIGETAWNWNDLKVTKTEVGETRFVCKGPTATLNELEMHVTTLNPGVASHPPHKHPNEELVLIDKGTVEALIDGQWKKLGPGSIVLNASNVTHAMRNVGLMPAQYHVINWTTDKTPKP